MSRATRHHFADRPDPADDPGRAPRRPRCGDLYLTGRAWRHDCLRAVLLASASPDSCLAAAWASVLLVRCCVGDSRAEQTSWATLPHSGLALVIGLVGAIFGGRGLANTLQNTLNTVWSVPKVVRPGFPFNPYLVPRPGVLLGAHA